MSPNSMYSLLQYDIGLTRDSLKSVEDEQNRYMDSLKLQNKKVSDAIARLEILAAVVNDYSMMDSSLRAQSGTSSTSESVKVIGEEKNPPRQFASGTTRENGVICDFVTGEDNKKDAGNTVDTCLKELSTSRPSLTNKRAKNRDVPNGNLYDLTTGAQQLLLSNKVSNEETPCKSSPSPPVFQEKGCIHSTSLHGNDVADEVEETIVLTAYECGTIIGKQGTTINKLERMSGAQITVTHLRGVKEGQAVIEGRADQVRKATKMIKEIMEDSVIASLTFSSTFNKRNFIGVNGCKIRELGRSTNTVIRLVDSVSGRHGDKDSCEQITVRGFKDDVIKAIQIIQQVKGVGEYILDKL